MGGLPAMTEKLKSKNIPAIEAGAGAK